jgi:hypothetical protein
VDGSKYVKERYANIIIKFKKKKIRACEIFVDQFIGGDIDT